MSGYEILTVDIARLQHRSAYGPLKRVRRRILRAMDRWPRADYDVHLVLEHGRIAYKKITFNKNETADRITASLQRFGPCEHLPRWRHTDGRQLWVDYVAGRPYNRMNTLEIDEIARCFTEFASRGSRCLPLERSGYWTRHQANLAGLHDHGLIDARLAEALRIKSAQRRPSHLRTGFDYRDPIAPNLVQRADTGAFCAIDIKNWHADTLVGEGLAKATDRWLDAGSRSHILDRMSNNGLDDVAEAFDFLEIYERCARIYRSAQIETAALGRIRKHSAKTARLAALAG